MQEDTERSVLRAALSYSPTIKPMIFLSFVVVLLNLEWLSPQGTFDNNWIHFCLRLCRCRTGYQHLQAQGATKHLKKDRRAPSTHKYVAQNVNSREIEKCCFLGPGQQISLYSLTPLWFISQWVKSCMFQIGYIRINWGAFLKTYISESHTRPKNSGIST